MHWEPYVKHPSTNRSIIGSARPNHIKLSGMKTYLAVKKGQFLIYQYYIRIAWITVLRCSGLTQKAWGWVQILFQISKTQLWMARVGTLIKSAQRQPEKQKNQSWTRLEAFCRSALQYVGRVTKKTASISAHSILGSSQYLQLLHSMSIKFLRNACLEVKLSREVAVIQWGV